MMIELGQACGTSINPRLNRTSSGPMTLKELSVTHGRLIRAAVVQIQRETFIVGRLNQQLVLKGKMAM